MSALSTGTITPTTKVEDVLRRDPSTYGVFEEHGLHFCAGCFIAVTGTIADGAAFNAIRDVDSLVSELNQYLESRESAG
ncbi:MAG: hypothetical protein ACYDAY_00905 [Candidatus Dormibacteria bacterium]